MNLTGKKCFQQLNFHHSLSFPFLSKYLFFLTLIPSFLFSQEQSKGVQWTKGLSFEQVIQKAKSDGKMIFVDCYTTWCKPCKMMDKNIYPSEKVGAFFREHFISVRIQMDKTRNDNEDIRKMYQDAAYIDKTYSIDAYPTFLFLSPEGKALHRASGAFSEDKFIAIAKEALSPESQSYTLAEKYDPEKMDTAEMKKVAISIRRSAPELAAKIILKYFKSIDKTELSSEDNLDLLSYFSSSTSIQDFTKNYINSLTEQELLEKKNITLINRFLSNSKDRGFKFFYNNYGKVDDVMNHGFDYKSWFTKNIIDGIIYQEQVAGKIEQGQETKIEPDWNLIYKNIKYLYGDDYATRITLKGKMNWFGGNKQWKEYCKNVIAYMDKYADKLEFDWTLNQYAWAIFTYSNDKAQLQKALTWSQKAIMMNPIANWMDTYANILYKLGHNTRAVHWQEIALKLDGEDKRIQEKLVKMKDGTPTWPMN
jgi:thioredoxin-related protein